MRFISIVAAFLLLVILGGCGSSQQGDIVRGTHDLKAVENQFHQNPASNRTVSTEQVPLQFTDINGKEVDLASYRGRSNVVLVVVKGLPTYPGNMFCPGCLAQVNSLAANYDEFKKRHAEVVVVFPGATEKIPEFLAQSKVDGEGGNPELPFALLLDKELKAVDSLGIRGDLAKPSTYILDKSGSVVFAFVGETTTDRPSVKSLFAQLDRLETN